MDRIDVSQLERLGDPDEKVLFYCEENVARVRIIRKKSEMERLQDPKGNLLAKDIFLNTGKMRIGIGRLGVMWIYEYQRAWRSK